MFLNTEKCENCIYSDKNWREYSQLITFAHPILIAEHKRPIWSMYALERFCKKNKEFRDSKFAIIRIFKTKIKISYIKRK